MSDWMTDQGDRNYEAGYDEAIAKLRALPARDVIGMMEGLFIGDSARVFADYLQENFEGRALTHGWSEKRCERCVYGPQIAHAAARAVWLPWGIVKYIWAVLRGR